MHQTQAIKNTPTSIDMPEKRTRLFNIIYESVILEIDTLRAMPNNKGMSQAIESEKALDRLMMAIEIKNYSYSHQGTNWGDVI